MGVKQYFEFNGVKYGIGTIISYPITDCRWGEPAMQTVRFCGGGCFTDVVGHGGVELYGRFFDGTHPGYHKSYVNYIEIVKPVYYQEPESTEQQNIFLRTSSGSWDAHNEVCVGLVWYIAIMLIGVIFKDRWLIWIVATLVFFAWKSKK